MSLLSDCTCSLFPYRDDPGCPQHKDGGKALLPLVGGPGGPVKCAGCDGVDGQHSVTCVNWTPPQRRTADFKTSNPKDAVGDTKVALAFLSPVAEAHWALAQHAGRTKYGAWNWREAGVRASVYISAIKRHTAAYLSGEQHDPADGTHHLGNIMACCAILLEAEARGNLTDDRPPRLDMRPTYEFVERQQAVLTEKYKDRQPKHWTIADTSKESPNAS